MNYIQITSERDKDIPYLLSVHKRPEISRFISIDEENYFYYVTTSESVFYFKVFMDDLCYSNGADAVEDKVGEIELISSKAHRGNTEEKLAATVHCELNDGILYMSIMVIPGFQNQGVGTEILHDIQNGVLALPFTHIKVSIDKCNMASLRLFRKMGFHDISEDEELMDFVWSA